MVLDIFKTELTNNGFTKPENLKYPINTPYDDFGIIFEDEEELQGYLSSNRKGLKNGNQRVEMISIL